MTASEKSFVGIAKQSTKGVPIIDSAAFSYFLFQDGTFGPSNVYLPTEDEIGGGALQNDVDNVGVISGGQMTFIPRPEMLGHLLLGALGTEVGEPELVGTKAYKHTFAMGPDQFEAPYFTFRASPGGMWGEQFADCRLAALSLNWRAADRLRGEMAIQGGEPVPDISMADWDAMTKVDRGPTFLAPKFTVTFPGESEIKVLSGAIAMGMSIPLEEQWITGSYYPDAQDITRRIITVTLGIKVINGTLYKKAQYDADGGSSWVANVLKDGGFALEFQTSQPIEGTTCHSLKLVANGQSGNAGNVAWTCTPVRLSAGRQVTMTIAGVFLADPTGENEPVTAELVNTRQTKY